MKHIILILVAMLLPVGALAQTAPVAVKKEGEGGWIVEGKKMDDTPSKKSLHGFGASLVVIKNESFFTLTN